MKLTEDEYNQLAGELFINATSLKRFLGSESSLSSLKIPQLRTLANWLRTHKNSAVRTSGAKKDIISRIWAAMQAPAVATQRFSPYPPTSTTSPSVASSSTSISRYSSLQRPSTTPLSRFPASTSGSYSNFTSSRSGGWPQRSQRTMLEEEVFQKILKDKSLKGAISPFFPINTLLDVIDLTDLQNSLSTNFALTDTLYSQLVAQTADGGPPKFQLQILLMTNDFKAANWHPDIKVYINEAICNLPKPKTNSKKKAVVFMTCDPVVSHPQILLNPQSGVNKLQIHFIKNYRMTSCFLVIHVAEVKTVDELVAEKKAEYEQRQKDKQTKKDSTKQEIDSSNSSTSTNAPNQAGNQQQDLTQQIPNLKYTSGNTTNVNPNTLLPQFNGVTFLNQQPQIFGSATSPYALFGMNPYSQAVQNPNMIIGNPYFNPLNPQQMQQPLRGPTFESSVQALAMNNQQNQANYEEEDSEDDIIVEKKEVVSLLDPLTLSYITCPVKGCGCSHNQPFDLEMFLTFAETSSFWNCPVCNKPAPYPEVQIDEKSDEIIKALADDIEKEAVEKVILNEEDGTWKPLGMEKVVIKDKELAQKANALDDDEMDEAERKKKEEEEKFHHQNVVEVVELSDEDGEDEDEDGSKSPALYQPSSSNKNNNSGVGPVNNPNNAGKNQSTISLSDLLQQTGNSPISNSSSRNNVDLASLGLFEVDSRNSPASGSSNNNNDVSGVDDDDDDDDDADFDLASIPALVARSPNTSRNVTSKNTANNSSKPPESPKIIEID